jgi:hypothetical protein
MDLLVAEQSCDFYSIFDILNTYMFMYNILLGKVSALVEFFVFQFLECCKEHF